MHSVHCCINLVHACITYTAKPSLSPLLLRPLPYLMSKFMRENTSQPAAARAHVGSKSDGISISSYLARIYKYKLFEEKILELTIAHDKSHNFSCYLSTPI
jgi:hypothetical protein